MNLREEQNYQKLLELLDDLQLSEKNYNIAKQYLDMTQPENRALLEQVEPQNYNELDDVRSKSTNYIDMCYRKNQIEKVERYIRFISATGGFTARYILAYGYSGLGNRDDDAITYLPSEQQLAMRIKKYMWTIYNLERMKEWFEENDLDVLRNTMKLYSCKEVCHAKMLVSGMILYYTNKVDGQQADEKTQEIIDYLWKGLVQETKSILKEVNVSAEDIKVVEDYLQVANIEEPIPTSISSILHKKDFDTASYSISFITVGAFLAIEHSERFLNLLRLLIAMDKEIEKNYTLDMCFKVGGRKWFYKHVELLEKILPIEIEDYIVWCAKKKADKEIERISMKYPEKIEKAIDKANLIEISYMINTVKNTNKELYERLGSSYINEFSRKFAKTMTNHMPNGEKQAEQYLLGEEKLDNLYPFIKEWREHWYVWHYYNKEWFENVVTLKDYENEEMYKRAVVLLAFGVQKKFFDEWWLDGVVPSKEDNKYSWKIQSKAQLKRMIQILSQEGVLPIYQLETLAGFYEGIYGDYSKKIYMNSCLEVLKEKKEEWNDTYCIAVKDGNVEVRSLCVRFMENFPEEYKEVLLSCSKDSSKQVRELLIPIYANHKEWEKEVKALLYSKKSQEREIAVQVLKKWGIEAYREELLAVLEKEKGKKVKELIEQYLVMEQAEEQSEKTFDDFVKELLKGGKRRKLDWAYKTPFPVVHKLDGSECSEDFMKAFLMSYADMQTLGVNKETKRFVEKVNADELAVYMKVLYERWLEDGAESKKKWVLYVVSIHGGETIVPILYKQIGEWPNVARSAIAAEAVKALALNGSSTALLQVDQLARKCKFRQVKAAANEALGYAAKQLGITKAELEDRIVPNLGFDESMERVFDYGARTFTVALTPALELFITDETGKKLKNLPSPGKKDEEEKAKASYEEFKLLKKQLKTVVANQKLRLEQALSTRRLWTAKKWKELFVENPVMHQFAIGLIWGRYEEDITRKERLEDIIGKELLLEEFSLKDTFRYMEDGSFNTVDEEEYEFLEDGMIGLVHPIELEEEDREAWKEQLSDYEITQPIEQLERDIYLLTEEEMDEKELTRFGGKVLNTLSLSGKMLGQGWYRGSVGDGGWYHTFYREDGKLGAALEFSGANVSGYESEEDVIVYGVQFYKAGTVTYGSYMDDSIKEENKYVLSEVEPRYMSEIILQLTKITASSKEQLKYPECRENGVV